MKARSLLAVVLAALLVPAAATAAPAKAKPAASSSGAGLQGLSVGGFIGWETDDVGGLALRADGELPFRALSPQINLSWVGSIGFSHLTDDMGFADLTANVLKIVPAARFTFPINPQLSLFGDAGLGLAYVSAKVESPFFPSVDDSTINLMMRIGVGAWYHVNEKTRIGAMLEFFGDFGFSGAGASSQTTFNILGGAMFKL
jgi:opacity protein-like surface antigen